MAASTLMPVFAACCLNFPCNDARPSPFTTLKPSAVCSKRTKDPALTFNFSRTAFGKTICPFDDTFANNLQRQR
jgi:hypothetical protein